MSMTAKAQDAQGLDAQGLDARGSAADEFDLDGLDDLEGLEDLEGLDAAQIQRLLDEEEAALAAEEAAGALPPVPAAGAMPIAIQAAAPAAAPEDTSELTLFPVPRVNIHAFCQDANLTALFEAAAADRRLDRAHVTIQNGDAFRAAQVFAHEPTPNLIVLEAGDSAQDLLEGLGSLADVCDPSTQVMVIGQLNDIALYRALMERGISEYLIAPRGPLQIVSAISALYADREAAPVGKTYAFVGARGGVGSSSVCHSVAWAMAELCKTDTVLVDMDLAFGTASLDFEQDPSQGLSEALGAPERLDDVLLDRLLQRCTDRLSLFAAPNLLDRDYDIAPDSFEQVVDLVRGTAPAVALDLPHLWSAWTQKQLQTADEVVVTATPDLAAFRNAKNIFETLSGVRGGDGEPVLVLNQTGVKGRPEVGADQFAESLGVAPRAVIEFDPQSFGLASTNAQVLQEAAPKSKAGAVCTELARLLLGQGATASAKPSGVKGLLGLFG